MTLTVILRTAIQINIVAGEAHAMSPPHTCEHIPANTYLLQDILEKFHQLKWPLTSLVLAPYDTSKSFRIRVLSQPRLYHFQHTTSYTYSINDCLWP